LVVDTGSISGEPGRFHAVLTILWVTASTWATASAQTWEEVQTSASAQTWEEVQTSASAQTWEEVQTSASAQTWEEVPRLWHGGHTP
jgi:hypothetical protein